MALGIKTYPKNTFEIGDLAFAKTSEAGTRYTYQSQPSDNSSQFELVSDGSPLLFGQVLRDEVEDTEIPYFTWLEIKTVDGRIGYILRDYALYRTEANPEYNYPEKVVNTPFDWSGLFNTISGVATSILGVFNSKNQTSTTATSGETTTTTTATTVTEESFFKKNGVTILIGSLVAFLLFLIFKKPKNRSMPYQGNQPINPNQNNYNPNYQS